MGDKIEITRAEFNDDWTPSVGFYYAAWRRNGEVDYGYGNPDDAGETKGIPDDIRIALALAVAPGLVEAVKAPEKPRHDIAAQVATLGADSLLPRTEGDEASA